MVNSRNSGRASSGALGRGRSRHAKGSGALSSVVPDLSSYHRLDEATAHAVKDVDAGLQVGGPALSPGVDEWLVPFADFVAARALTDHECPAGTDRSERLRRQQRGMDVGHRSDPTRHSKRAVSSEVSRPRSGTVAATATPSASAIPPPRTHQ